MRRNVYDKIVAWHKARKRKPLVLMGARQVGKTWLMEHFAAEYYPLDTVEINLMRDELLRDNFERVDLKPQTVVSLIELATGKRIVPGKTLLIIDEIQESMRALTSLKFFCEELPARRHCWRSCVFFGPTCRRSLRRRTRSSSTRPCERERVRANTRRRSNGLIGCADGTICPSGAACSRGANGLLDEWKGECGAGLCRPDRNGCHSA